MKSVVTLTVNGTSYGGWKTINIALSIEKLSGAFQVEMAVQGGEKEATPTSIIKPSDACTIDINGQTIITGYIDRVAPTYDAGKHVIQITGRDKAGDLVDCSVVHETGQFLDQTIDRIITTICDPFGIPVNVEADVGEPLKFFSIDQSATCFQTIQKLCNMRQVLCVSDGKGGISLTRSGSESVNASLIEGENILAGAAEYDFSERFSLYIAKGQKMGTLNDTPQTIAQNIGQASDDLISRYRPLLIIPDGQSDNANCQAIAEWEQKVRSGKSRRLDVTVAGFTMGKGGELWPLNKMVQVDAPLLYVRKQLLIASINFALNDGGELTTLSLTERDAFETLDIPKAKKSQLNQYQLGDEFETT